MARLLFRSLFRSTLMASCLLAALGAHAASYDVVINGGRVIDPQTRLDAVRHIGIRDGKIAAISKTALSGARTINAQGLVVSPGFIDLHAHGQQLPAARMQAHDGVTTALELESGILPVNEFYAKTGAEGRPINYGTSSSWAFARIAVIESMVPAASLTWFQKAFAHVDWQKLVATPSQQEQILARVEQGLKEGGLGVGINAGYSPTHGVKEYHAVNALAKRYEVPTFTHIRNMSVIDPASSFAAYQELIATAVSTGAQMHICHLNSSSLRDSSVFGLIRSAQKNGAKITVEAYPYGAASTAIGAALLRGNWRDRTGMVAGDLEVGGKALDDAALDGYQAKAPGTPVVMHFLHDADNEADRKQLDSSVLYPEGIIASDGVPWVMPDGTLVEGSAWPMPQGAFAHPRGAGTYARFLRIYVRERGQLSWLDALRKATLLPAQVLEKSVPQMRNKGRLQVGKDADIVIFDPQTISDRATFTAPAQTSAGISHVIVNGQAVITDGVMDVNAMPGQAIRRARSDGV
jgi:N-acyl-D-glutamate deacylase